MGFSVRCEYEASGTKTITDVKGNTCKGDITDVQVCIHDIDDDITNFQVDHQNIPLSSFTKYELLKLDYTGDWHYSRVSGIFASRIITKVVYDSVKLKKITVISDE